MTAPIRLCQYVKPELRTSYESVGWEEDSSGMMTRLIQPKHETHMKLVILESPYAAPTAEEIEENVTYARACIRDSLLRGEAPIASHLLYTQPGILRDEVPEERKHGIDAGLAWREVADASVIYTDRGISKGMEYGIADAEKSGRPIEYRKLDKYNEAI